MKAAVTLFGRNAMLLLVLATMIWGGNAVAGKLAVGSISPLLLTATRWCIAAVILGFIARHHLRRDWPVIKQNWWYFAIVGPLGFSIFNTFLYTALLHTSAINAAILQSGMPMVIFILSYLVFRIKTTWAQIIGYSLTLAGVLLVAGQGDLSLLLALEINRGDLIMIGGVLTYATFSVALRSKPEMHWLSFLTVLAIPAAIAAVPFALYEWSQGDLIWTGTPKAFALAAFTAIFPSIVSQACFIRSVELIGGNKAGIYLNMVPIWGAVFAVLLVGEIFHLYHGISLIMVIGGILLAQALSQQK